jgi:peptide/nickel transport system ATP-binding protein
MYLGRIVETGQTREVWSAPLHPYTEALIAAVPRPDGSGTMPDALPGEVPDPARPPTGCRFHPRCPYRFSRCPVEEPELEQAFATRTVSCWLPRDPVPTPPSRRTAHTSSTTATNDSSASSSQEEGAMPTHKGGTA